MKLTILFLSFLLSTAAQAAIINGSVSGTGADVGATSKGAYAEIVDSSGKLQGASKQRYTLSATNFTAATTEALVTLTPYTDGVAGTPATTFAVPANKRLVIQGICVTTKNAGAAVQGVITRIRINPTGAAATSSEPQVSLGTGTSSATANVVGSSCINVSQGTLVVQEISGTAQIGVSQIGTATAGNDVTLWGYLY